MTLTLDRPGTPNRAPSAPRRRPWRVLGQRRFWAIADANGPFRRTTTILILLLVFTFPWQTTVGALGAPKVIGAITIAVGIVAIAVEGRRTRLIDFHILVLAFAAWSLLSIIWTIDLQETVPLALAMAEMAMLVLLIWEFCPGAEGARWVARAYVWGAFVPAGQIIYKEATGGRSAVRRIAVGVANPNDTAFILALAIPLALYLAFRRRGWPAVAYSVFVVAALYAIFLTGSRSGLINGLLGLVFGVWALIAGHPRRAAFLLLAVATAIPILAPMLISRLPQEQLARQATTAQELASGDLNHRTTLWSAAWETYSANPILGVGTGSSRDTIGERTGFDLRSHNAELSVMSELGTVGIVLFTLIFLVAGYRAFGGRGNERRLTIVLFLVLVVGLQTRHWEYEKPVWTVLAIVCALGGRPRSGWVAPLFGPATAEPELGTDGADAPDPADPSAMEDLTIDASRRGV